MALAIGAMVSLVACGTGASNSAAGSNPPGPASSAGQPASVKTTPPPAGLPAFYGVPDPLAPGKPGEIVRIEPVAASTLHGTLWRVMYHSRSISDRDIAVTGLIAVPTTPPPAGGYQVVTWAHGTTGIADTCAPSIAPDATTITLANALLDKGYLVTATDYEGMGTPGRHPYIVGESEARGVLDIVRAARTRPEFHAGDRYLVWGHSQGGHAAVFALHIADQWAPELHLVGTVAGAPPSQLAAFYPVLRNSPFKYYLLMAAAGINAAYGDQKAPLDAVLNPAGLAALTAVDQGCAGSLARATAGIDAGTLVKGDPASVPQWAKLLKANDPGQFTQASAEPLLIIQGGSDEQIPVVSTKLLFLHLCAIGQTEQRWVYPGMSHAGVIAVSLSDMLTWIGHRFAGQPAPDPTPPVGAAGIDVLRCPA